MREFFQVIDFRSPHNTGLVYEIDKNAVHIEGFYPVVEIMDEGVKLSPDHYSKDFTVLLEGLSEEYLDYLVERTKNILLEEVKLTNDYAQLEESKRCAADFKFGECQCWDEPTVVLTHPKALRHRKTGDWVVVGEQDGEFFTLMAPYPDLFTPEYTEEDMVNRFGSKLMNWGKLELVRVKIEVV